MCDGDEPGLVNDAMYYAYLLPWAARGNNMTRIASRWGWVACLLGIRMDGWMDGVHWRGWDRFLLLGGRLISRAAFF